MDSNNSNPSENNSKNRKFIEKFLLTLEVTHGYKTKRFPVNKASKRRERKRQINRMSAQRKRIREREKADDLSEKFRSLSEANVLLKTNNRRLSALLEQIKVHVERQKSLEARLPPSAPSARNTHPSIAPTVPPALPRAPLNRLQQTTHLLTELVQTELARQSLLQSQSQAIPIPQSTLNLVPIICQLFSNLSRPEAQLGLLNASPMSSSPSHSPHILNGPSFSAPLSNRNLSTGSTEASIHTTARAQTLTENTTLGTLRPARAIPNAPAVSLGSRESSLQRPTEEASIVNVLPASHSLLLAHPARGSEAGVLAELIEQLRQFQSGRPT
jgi:hypothetical protein